MNDIRRARSLLFVPGDRADRFGKALASGADAVIADLEDGVRAGRRREARTAVAEWARTAPESIAVRVNPMGSLEGEDDLIALWGIDCAIVVPKAESRQDVERASDGGARPVVALIETARGIRDVSTWASTPGLVRLALGNVDLASSLGVDPASRDALRAARAALVIASAAEGLAPPIDGVTIELRDGSVLAADLGHARELGFAGKLCIHPDQVRATNEAFLPTRDEVEWAQGVVAAPDGATRVGDQMVDAPLVRRARSILALHAEAIDREPAR